MWISKKPTKYSSKKLSPSASNKPSSTITEPPPSSSTHPIQDPLCDEEVKDTTMLMISHTGGQKCLHEWNNSTIDKEATISLDNLDSWISSCNLALFFKALALDNSSRWIDKEERNEWPSKVYLMTHPPFLCI